MVSSPKGLGPEKDCAGKGPQHIRKDRPVLSSERAPHEDKTVTVTHSNKYLVEGPRWGLTPRLTD
jgi:hypothetical protein